MNKLLLLKHPLYNGRLQSGHLCVYRAIRAYTDSVLCKCSFYPVKQKQKIRISLTL